jgi:hypothetical protein
MTMATRMARRSRSALVFLAAAATRGACESGCGEGGAGDQVGGSDGLEEGR